MNKQFSFPSLHFSFLCREKLVCLPLKPMALTQCTYYNMYTSICYRDELYNFNDYSKQNCFKETLTIFYASKRANDDCISLRII